MIRWDEEDPGAGVMMGPLGFAATLRRCQDALTQVAAGVEGVRGTLGPQTWDGEAATAWQVEAGSVRARQAGLAEVVGPVHAALERYADAVVALQSQVVFHRQVREDAERMRYAMGGFDAGASPAVVARKAMLADQAAQEEHAANAALRDLATQRQALDETLVAALAVPASSGWAQRKEVLSRAGITGVEALSTAKLVDAYTRFADQALDGDLKSGDVTYLRGFFDAWGQDPVVMDAYFQALGGERTRDLVSALGTAMGGVGDETVDPGLLASTALALRAGLSTGSQGWSGKQAASFVDGLLHRASPVVGGSFSTLGWIFGDASGAPMGPSLAVAAADRLDAWERPTERVGVAPVIDQSAVSGGRYLSWNDHPDVAGRAPSDDATGRVFETLGLYPTEAMAWLTPQNGDTEIDWGRVDYWFGVRDWATGTTGDGFAGPAALWAGALQVEGGRTAEVPDPGMEKRSAALTGQVMDALGNNTSLTPVGVDDLGARNLYRVLEVHVRDFAMYPITHESEAQKGTVVVGERVLLSDGSYHSVPNVSDAALGKVMGIVGENGSTQSALGRLLLGEIDQYGTDAANGRGPTLVDVATHVTSLEGFAEGSGNGAAYLRAAYHDEQNQAFVDVASSAVGLVPVSAPGLQLGVDFVAGEAVTAVGKQVTGSSWLNSRAAAGVTGDSSIESMLVDRRAAVGQLLAELVATGHHDQEWDAAVGRHVAAGLPSAEAERLAMTDLVDAAVNAGRAGASSGTPDYRD